ncbi:MAG: efflux RND transporter permease subunit [Pseudomonadota bacterium]
MDTLLYRRPRYLALAVMVIAALGVFAFTTIGRQEDPTITNLFATITTPYPGADPARVEALVTEKIEASLREIPEIDVIQSTSRPGISTVQIDLSEIISDDRIEQVWSEVRDALADAAVDFPPGVPEPTFDNDRTGAFTAIVSVTAREGREVSTALMGRIAEALQERLRQVPATKLVSLYGEAAEEIRVEVEADALASLGLTPGAVAGAIAAADAKVSAGRVRGGSSDYLVEVAGEIDGLARVRDVPLLSAAGQTVRVGDIARVTRAQALPPEAVAFVDGRRAVLIAARVADDRQVDVWAGYVREEVAAAQAALPDGLAMELVFDQSVYTADRLGDVAVNLAIGVALVVAVLFVTMGWRSAAIVGAMLPLTALLSLVVLEKLGVTIHQMSVTGLIVALGLLVDAAIVTTDEIRRRLQAGTRRLEAVRGAVRRLTIPLAASTATTVLAFVPMAALPGPAGDFVGAIALSVIVMLIASLLLALTVTPAIAGMLLPDAPGNRGETAPEGEAAATPRRRGGLFAASLDASLRWRRLSLAVAALPAVVGFLAFPTLKAQFFPEVDRDQFHVQVEMASGTALARTADAALVADAILRTTDGIEGVQWVVGRSAPPFYYNMLQNRDRDPGFAEALVTTASAETTEAVIPALQTRLDAALPGARVLVRGLKQGPPVDAPVELRLVGPNLETLRTLGEAAKERMADVASITHTRATLTGGAPKLVFDLDEERVRQAGLDLGAVARQLDTLSEGALGGSLVEGPEELPVRVRLAGDDRSAAERLSALTVVPDGATADAASFPGVPLLALGAVRVTPSDSAIARRNGERVNTVQAFLTHGVLPDVALAEVRARLAADPLALPAGYRIEWGGDSDARGETVQNLLSVVGLVVVASVATIVLTFNSWRLSSVTLVVAVLSMGLSLLALEVFAYPFGIQALIGVIGAIGVSINAAIIILTALQEDPAAARGDRAAIREVVLGSSRHIVSTTVTTFGGFLPLILAGGGFWPPFAMAVAGGVLLSAVVSFYFVPPAFSLLTPSRPVPEPAAVEPGTGDGSGADGGGRSAPACDDWDEDDILVLRVAAE